MCARCMQILYIENYVIYDIQDLFNNFTVLPHMRHTQKFKIMNFEFLMCLLYVNTYYKKNKLFDDCLTYCVNYQYLSTKGTTYPIFKDLEKIKKIAFSEGIFFLKF